MEYLETEKCLLLSGGGVERREESGAQGVRDHEKMEKFVQKPGGSSIGRNPGEVGVQCKTAVAHMWEPASFVAAMERQSW